MATSRKRPRGEEDSVDVADVVHDPVNARGARRVGRWFGTMPMAAEDYRALEARVWSVVTDEVNLSLSDAGAAAPFKELDDDALIAKVPTLRCLDEPTRDRVLDTYRRHCAYARWAVSLARTRRTSLEQRVARLERALESAVPGLGLALSYPDADPAEQNGGEALNGSHRQSGHWPGPSRETPLPARAVPRWSPAVAPGDLSAADGSRRPDSLFGEDAFVGGLGPNGRTGLDGATTLTPSSGAAQIPDTLPPAQSLSLQTGFQGAYLKL